MFSLHRLERKECSFAPKAPRGLQRRCESGGAMGGVDGGRGGGGGSVDAGSIGSGGGVERGTPPPPPSS